MATEDGPNLRVSTARTGQSGIEVSMDAMKAHLPSLWIAALGIAALVSAITGTKRNGNTPVEGTEGMTAGPAAYPFDWCPVSGKTLCDRENPITFVFEGQMFEFCCSHCRESFAGAPSHYVSRMDPERPRP